MCEFIYVQLSATCPSPLSIDRVGLANSKQQLIKSKIKLGPTRTVDPGRGSHKTGKLIFEASAELVTVEFFTIPASQIEFHPP